MTMESEHSLESLCRFCLKDTNGETCLTLFTSLGLNNFLKNKIEKCLNVELLKNTKKMPNQVCVACSKQLDNAYKFILQYECTQEKLKNTEPDALATEKSIKNDSLKSDYLVNNNNKTKIEKMKHREDKNNETMITNMTDESYLVIVNEVGNVYPQTSTNNLADSVTKDAFEVQINEPPRKVRRTAADSSIYECQICYCVFKNKNAIYSHMKKHSNKLLNHKELFQNYLNGLCAEDDIQDIVSKIISENGIDSTNLGEPFFNQCQLCPAVFASKAQLSKHIQRHCETDNSLKYPLIKNEEKKKCIKLKKEKNVVYNNNNINNETTQKENEGKSEENIQVCDKNFDTNTGFSTCLKINNPVKNLFMNKKKEKQKCIFQCNDCNKIFSSKVNIRKHVVIHLSKRRKNLFICDICGKEYISVIACETHKLKHDPNYELACQYCSSKFKLKKLLQEHLKSHSKKGNHSCSTYNTNDPEIVEAMTHEEKNVGSNICKEEFNSVEMLNDHLDYHEYQENKEILKEDIEDANKHDIKTLNVDEMYTTNQHMEEPITDL
ncbi:uncharacterized protein LOC142321797 [Lycorma delicatula]|uniref:uncharacterized protein LOC142321797 n=1 Tax=Lycorma delicatula TaxID=130591 RepID=UPI003F50EA55